MLVIVTGTLSQYGPGRMESNIALRQAGETAHDLPMDLSRYEGFVAVLNCDDVGKTVYLRPVSCPECEWRKFLAADCAGKADGGYAWMKEGNIIGEIGHRDVLYYSELLGKDYMGRGIPAEMAIEVYRYAKE